MGQKFTGPSGITNAAGVVKNPATEEKQDDIISELSNIAKGLVVDPYDYIGLTYVAAGNGEGEIETATYKSGGSGGTTVATLSLTYDASDRISTVTKT